MNKKILLILSFYFIAIVFASCSKKEFDEYYGRPENLEEPVYQILREKGNFSMLLQTIDKAGYADILGKSGYWTMFAPNDEAFNAFLQEKGFSSIDDIDSTLAGQIVKYGLIYNAFRTERLPDYQSSGGWVENAAFKRRTAYYDGFKTQNIDGQERVVIGSNRNNTDGTNYYVSGDNNNKYITYFADEFLYARGYGAYDYIRKEMSEEQLDEYDRNFEKYIDMPISDIPGIRQIPKRFLGFAEDTDIVLKEQIKELESDKASIIAGNNQEIDSFLLNYRYIKTEEDKEGAIKEMEQWLNKINAKNPDEGKRLLKRYEKRNNLDNLELARGVVELTINKSPQTRALAIAYEMIKYKDNNSTQIGFMKEIQAISPVKRNKRTGYFNDETLKHYNSIMENFNKNGILENPIFINK